MNTSLAMSKEKSNLLASRDKTSVIRSFQATLENQSAIKPSIQRGSRIKQENGTGPKIRLDATISQHESKIDDADKIAKDAGGSNQDGFL